MNIIQPPRITGTTDRERLAQVIGYLNSLVQQLNMALEQKGETIQ